jgi:G3E family GTPase
MAILERLNARAEIIAMVMGEVPLKNPQHRSIRLRKSRRGTGLVAGVTGEHVPETEEYGIASTVYRARRPFHPQRFFSFIDRPWVNGKLLRSKGFSGWRASIRMRAVGPRPGLMRHGFAGRWWRFVPKDQWPQEEERPASWRTAAATGDCRQELVFIGQNIDFAHLTDELDGCLLTEEEMALGVEGWQRLPDPFGPWHEEAA